MFESILWGQHCLMHVQKDVEIGALPKARQKTPLTIIAATHKHIKRVLLGLGFCYSRQIRRNMKWEFSWTSWFSMQGFQCRVSCLFQRFHEFWHLQCFPWLERNLLKSRFSRTGWNNDYIFSKKWQTGSLKVLIAFNTFNIHFAHCLPIVNKALNKYDPLPKMCLNMLRKVL